jgi:hypothetical protein
MRNAVSSFAQRNRILDNSRPDISTADLQRRSGYVVRVCQHYPPMMQSISRRRFCSTDF